MYSNVFFFSSTWYLSCTTGFISYINKLIQKGAVVRDNHGGSFSSSLKSITKIRTLELYTLWNISEFYYRKILLFEINGCMNLFDAIIIIPTLSLISTFFPFGSIFTYELSHPVVVHAVCVLRIASLLSACFTRHDLFLIFSFFPLSLSLSLSFSFSYHLQFSVSLGETRFAGSWNMLTFTGDRGPSTREWENREWRTRRD